MLHRLQFTTSHCQFYLHDEGSPAATDSVDFWTEEALKDRLAVEEGILGISTETYSNVNATISLLNAHPAMVDLAFYDHVVEGSLEIKSGILQVLDCPNSEVQLEFKVMHGFYRVRISSCNLDSVVDEFEDANDTYQIEIWAEAPSARQVLKQYVWPKTNQI